MSDTARCPHCQKYIDTTFKPEQCPKCHQSLKDWDGKNEVFGQHSLPATEEEIKQFTNYLIPSVISLIFCCLPGIVAVVYSIMALNAKKEGDYVRANANASTASKWMIAAYILGLITAFFQFAGRYGGR